VLRLLSSPNAPRNIFTNRCGNRRGCSGGFPAPPPADEHAFIVRPDVEKRFDVLYNGRRSREKRHYLANQVGEHLRLALVYPHHDPAWYDVPAEDLPKHVYSNDVNLGPHQVCDIINQSHVGLILSAAEGACFASSESLLCGVPVISTPSVGGRSFWYNDENSAIVDADPSAILAAAKAMIAAPRDPHAIRAAHLDLMKRQRRAFLDNVLAPIREKFSLDWDYVSHFNNCRPIEELAFKKDCWRDLASICRWLQDS
jgi:hypothetical protein